jgi:hypothetical protein
VSSLVDKTTNCTPHSTNVVCVRDKKALIARFEANPRLLSACQYHLRNCWAGIKRYDRIVLVVVTSAEDTGVAA